MRNFTVCIYLVKAAELEIIRTTAMTLLRGLNFATVYTPHFAMCADNLSEIMMATNSAEIETRSVMRFSCSGLCPRPEMKKIRARMDELCPPIAETVGFWCKHEPEYFEKAATKAIQSLQKMLREIGRKSGDAFNVLIINNDILPMLELVASKDYNQLKIAQPGQVILFRYQVAVGPGSIMNWQLVHAYNFN